MHSLEKMLRIGNMLDSVEAFRLVFDTSDGGLRDDSILVERGVCK